MASLRRPIPFEREDGDPRAGFAILDEVDGELDVKLLRVDYPAHAVAEEMREQAFRPSSSRS